MGAEPQRDPVAQVPELEVVPLVVELRTAVPV
jgi:hypothetical protein